MVRSIAAALACALLVQDPSDAGTEKSKLHEEVAVAAEAAGEQLIKLKSWDEARAFLELIRAKSDARSEALDKLIAKADKQTSGLKWDAKSSDLIKSFGSERAKKFFAFALAWKEKDAEAARWTQAEGEILDDLLDYVKAYARLTQIRAHYELPKTRFDWKLSVPAVWHARYTLENPEDRIETEGKPGFTAEGKRVGSNSITSPKETLSELLEGLIHAPYYRNYVLNPGLNLVGLGQSHTVKTASVLDVKSGLGPSGPNHTVVLSPKDKTNDVAVCGYDDHIRVVEGVSMRDLGYPISAMFYGPNPEITSVKARLTAEMRDVEFILSSPENPSAPKGTPNQKTSIVLVPRERLKAGAEYKVSILYHMNDKECRAEWSFRATR